MTREEMQAFFKVRDNIVEVIRESQSPFSAEAAIGDIIEESFLTDGMLAAIITKVFKAGKIAGKNELQRRISLMQ